MILTDSCWRQKSQAMARGYDGPARRRQSDCRRRISTQARNMVCMIARATTVLCIFNGIMLNLLDLGLSDSYPAVVKRVHFSPRLSVKLRPAGLHFTLIKDFQQIQKPAVPGFSSGGDVE